MILTKEEQAHQSGLMVDLVRNLLDTLAAREETIERLCELLEFSYYRLNDAWDGGLIKEIKIALAQARSDLA